MNSGNMTLKFLPTAKCKHIQMSNCWLGTKNKWMPWGLGGGEEGEVQNTDLDRCRYGIEGRWLAEMKKDGKNSNT